MREIILSACALVAAAGSAMAQAGGSVEFRIREMSGQTVASSADAVLDFVVEGRVTQGVGRGLGDWSFDIAIAGENEGGGTFARLRINNADGSYYTGAPTTSTLGGTVAGVAAQYRYLVGLNGAFNGVINSSSGTFTNGPEQEIGLISGTARGAGLGNTGILVDDGNGNLIPATGGDFQTALDTFFGGSNNFVQLYRFRFSVSDFSARNLNFVLRNTTAATFASLVPAGTDFSGDTTGGGAQVSSSGAVISVIPAPASVALLGLGGLAIARRRR